MKLGITGSRDFTYLPFYLKAILLGKIDDISELIHGNAYGVDRLASAFLKSFNKIIKITSIAPDYKVHHPKIAPLERNTTIVNMSDEIIAVWDGKSNGTWDCLLKAFKAGKLKTLIIWDGYDKHFIMTNEEEIKFLVEEEFAKRYINENRTTNN